MSMVQQVSINGKDYNIAQAPAIKQRSLMTLIGPKIAMNKGSSAAAEINMDFLNGTLLSCDETLLTKISDIVLYKTFIDGTTDKITVESFQGAMMDYLKLIAEGVRINLQDFIDWLDRAGKEDAQEKKSQPSEIT